jgi:DNA-binding NtrC family response regulator
MTCRILVVDDTPLVCDQLRQLLELEGYEVQTAPGGRDALEMLHAQTFHLLITDLRMDDMGGVELLRAVRAERLPFGVVLLTGHGDTQIALDAMKAGADDFITKPCEPERLRIVVKRILERRRLIDEVEQLRLQMQEHYSFHNMVSKSARMRAVFDLIEQAGPLGSTVLIQGETGTGKELVARALHAAHQQDGPFAALSCAALQDSLLESELFGHEKGAFTGADRLKKGRFEVAHGGTLLLDEVGDVSPALQAKLLRVLETSSFERVGGAETIKVDVRIVAASNRRLDDEVKAGRFRPDLFYRLNVIRIDLPPLRERREDIPLLATHFLGKQAALAAQPVKQCSEAAMQALVAHSWPGNVRELENAIKGAVAMTEGPVIRPDALPLTVAPQPADWGPSSGPIDLNRPLPEVTSDIVACVERSYFIQLLERHHGNVLKCAKHSGLSRRSVTQKLHKYALNRADFRLAAGRRGEA